MIRYIAIAIFVAFAIIMFIISRKWKKNTLGTFELLPGENFLFDDDCSVEIKIGPSMENFPRARIRVTDQRIIVSQRGMGKKEWFLIRYVIHHLGKAAPEGIGGGALKTGFVTFRTIPQNMSVVYDEGQCIRIEPHGEIAMGVPQRLHIKTENIDQYKQALQIA